MVTACFSVADVLSLVRTRFQKRMPILYNDDFIALLQSCLYTNFVFFYENFNNYLV